MEQLNINFFLALTLSMFVPSFCFGHDLTELIDKCDFINFKKAYENSNVSEEQKTELLGKTDDVIEGQLKKLKPILMFGGKIPALKVGKQIKIKKLIFLFFSGIIFGGNVLPILWVYDTLCHIKNLPNRHNRLSPNARTQVNYRMGGILEKKLKNDCLGATLLFGGISLLSGLFYFLSRYFSNTLVVYKQYKKACKIQNLIQESRTNAPVTAENSEPVKIGV